MRPLLPLACMVLLSTPQQGPAFNASDRIELDVGITLQTAAGEISRVCGFTATVDGPVEWRARVTGGAGGQWDCLAGRETSSASSGGEPEPVASLFADLKFVARLAREIEDEQTLAIGFTAEVHEPADGDEFRSVPAIDRAFYFADAGQVTIPLRAADADRVAESTFDEVYVTFTVTGASGREATRLGDMRLGSAPESVRIQLDGARVTAVTAASELLIRNLDEGMHMLSVRHADGREFRQAVRIHPGRTVFVSLDPPDRSERFRLVPLGQNARGFDEYRRLADGATVVRVPAGEFLMGDADAERSPREHQVFVSGFLMDKTGVTWGQYKRFAAATGIPLPPFEPYWGMVDDHPVVNVTWLEAKGYCEWAGGRLPTEAEREKAARGTDGRKYPWGDAEPEPHLGVYRRSWGYEATAAVGTHPEGASPYGLLDMGGNVWEWCSDWYDGDYYASSPYRDPIGPPTGRVHVLRGGSWDSRPTVLATSVRNWGHRGYREGDFGFRCAMSAPGEGIASPDPHSTVQ